jgi:hypothetical protein
VWSGREPPSGCNAGAIRSSLRSGGLFHSPPAPAKGGAPSVTPARSVPHHRARTSPCRATTFAPSPAIPRLTSHRTWPRQCNCQCGAAERVRVKVPVGAFRVSITEGGGVAVGRQRLVRASNRCAAPIATSTCSFLVPRTPAMSLPEGSLRRVRGDARLHHQRPRRHPQVLDRPSL